MKLMLPRLRGAVSYAFKRVTVRRRLNPIYQAPELVQEAPPVRDELSINQSAFPFPEWALEGATARRWILELASRGTVGASRCVSRAFLRGDPIDTVAQEVL